MLQHLPIVIPTPIGSMELTIDEVLSFSSDERGGVRITLKEMISDINPEIICNYPYAAFKEWFDSHTNRNG